MSQTNRKRRLIMRMADHGLAAGERSAMQISLAPQAPLRPPSAGYNRSQKATDALADTTPAFVNPSR